MRKIQNKFNADLRDKFFKQENIPYNISYEKYSEWLELRLENLCNKQSVNASYLLGREDALNDIKGYIIRIEKDKTEELKNYKCLARSTKKNVLAYEKFLEALFTVKLCIFSNLRHTVFHKRLIDNG